MRISFLIYGCVLIFTIILMANVLLLAPVSAEPKNASSFQIEFYRDLGKYKRVNEATSTPDGRLLACVCQETEAASTILIFDLPHKHLVSRISLPHLVSSLVFAPNGQTLAFVAENYYPDRVGYSTRNFRIVLWSVHRHRVNRVLRRFPTDGDGLAFSSDGKLLLAGDSLNGTVGGQVIQVYSTSNWKLIKKLRGFTYGHLEDVAISTDKRQIAAITVAGETNQGELTVWNWPSGTTALSASDTDDSNNIHPPLFWCDNRNLLCGESYINMRRGWRYKMRRLTTLNGYQCVGRYSDTSILVTMRADTLTLGRWNTISNQIDRTWSGSNYNANVLHYVPRHSLVLVQGIHGSLSLLRLR